MKKIEFYLNLYGKGNLQKKRNFEKVKCSIMCETLEEGGLNLVSIKDQQQVFNLKWLKFFHNDTQKINSGHIFLNQIGGIDYLLHCSAGVDVKFLERHINSSFWNDVIKTWFILKSKIKNEMITTIDILSQPLFLNSEVKYKEKSLFIRPFINGNCRFVVDLLKNKQIINLKDIKLLINPYPGVIFDYNAIVIALPKLWKCKLKDVEDHDIINAKNRIKTVPDNVTRVFQKKNKELRSILNNSKLTIPCSQNFWKRKFGVDISNHFDIAMLSTSESRLRLLHFKILHNIYPTNIMLKKMKVKENCLCETCHVTDYTEHFFVECKLLQGFWSFLSNKILIDTHLRVKLTDTIIIFGFTKKDANNLSIACWKYINYIILIGKMCISKFKYGKIKNIYNIFEYEWQLRRNHIPPI